MASKLEPTCASLLPSDNDRKRSRNDINNDITEQETGAAGPLQDVVACLSGFTHQVKKELHQLVESLGGTYTRELNLDRNTHLITEVPHGAKYDLAAANRQMIHVVSSTWLHEAQASKERPLEADHQVSTKKIKISTTSKQPSTQPSRPSILTRLDDALNLPIENQGQRHALFQHHQFYLLEFDDVDNNNPLKQKLGTLIRRGNGTIYWELNGDVTVLVLCDGCDAALYKAAQIVSQHHVNMPPAVSPLWVVESYCQNALQPTRLFPPVPSVLSTSAIADTTKATTALMPSTASNSTVFRGCLFSFLKTKVDETPSSNAAKVLDFDVNEQAAFVKANGGQLLSSKLVEALKADAQKSQSSGTKTTTKRKCYVVCWGGGNPRIDTSPLVSQIRRDHLCEVLLVTPLWVQTCVTVRKRVRPERVPLILMPQSWSMKSVNTKGGRKKDGHQRRLDISLTGFQGTEKAAIIHLIGAVGGLYHDHLSNTNTHLICKETATGIKLEKAIQWGLHVVSVRWLYHVLEHGYGGAHNEAHGCEKRFSVVDASK